MSRAVNLIVIHCSATPDGRWTTALDIDRWHEDRGFARSTYWRMRCNPELKSIGYHFILYTNGAIATGRHLDEIGAHAGGHNAASIGICMIGTGAFTAAQWQALAGLVEKLRERYPAAKILGHRDLSPDADGDGLIEPREWLKTCPGFDVAGWRKSPADIPEHLVLEAEADTPQHAAAPSRPPT